MPMGVFVIYTPNLKIGAFCIFCAKNEKLVQFEKSGAILENWCKRVNEKRSRGFNLQPDVRGHVITSHWRLCDVQPNERHPRYSGVSFIICADFALCRAVSQAQSAPILYYAVLSPFCQK